MLDARLWMDRNHSGWRGVDAVESEHSSSLASHATRQKALAVLRRPLRLIDGMLTFYADAGSGFIPHRASTR
jgi:hypothetical protein